MPVNECKDIAVSVIMPSLNVAGYIQKALDSVVGQTLKNIEIVCIDAGSTDGTRELIEKYAQSDHRIRLINSSIKSYGYQVNTGIREAKGEYIAVLETDDYVTSGMYENLYKVAHNNRLDYVKCDYTVYWTQSDLSEFRIKRKTIPQEELYDKIIHPIDHITLANDDWYLWNGIYKKEFLEASGIYFQETKGAAFQDIGFLHGVITKASKAMYIKGNNYLYCIDREGASSNSKRDLEYAHQEYLKIYSDLNNKSREADFFYIRCTRSFVLACRNTLELEKKDSFERYKWFVNVLKNRTDTGDIDSISLDIRGDYKLLTTSLNKYIDKRNRKQKELIDFIGDDRAICFAIFGCGNFGCKAYQLLKKYKCHVRCFFDNNHLLWGNYIDKVSICSPEDISKLDGQVRIMVANEKYAVEIEKQIRKLSKNPEVLIFKYCEGLY